MSDCPCGSGDDYDACCGALHAGRHPAPTAEALMRARYSGFAVRDAEYLLATWHDSTRPETLDLDEQVTWRRLVVLRTDAGGPWDDAGLVEFVAHYAEPAGRGRLHETSRFVREHGRWLYVDGVVDA
ncbi:YchJ family protein [Cellulomonas sp. URHB0016]